MTHEANDLLEILLRECAAAAPQPWYPSEYVQQTGVPRGQVDSDLDRLRLAGLVRLTDWVQGKGQGYTLTSEGVGLLDNPRRLRRLRVDGVTPEPVPPPMRQIEVRSFTWDRGEAVRNSLLQPGRPTVTFLLISANVLMFFAGMYMARQEDPDLVGPYMRGLGDQRIAKVHVRLGLLNRQLVIYYGEWWRLLGYSFVHGGLFHVIMNMIALWVLGRMAEPMFGSLRFLWLYLVSGLGGGCAIALGDQAAVGASGSVCGILAAMGVWVFLNRGYLPPAGVARWFRGFLMNVFLIVIISTIPGVSALGHLGGGLAGAVIAVPLVYNRFGFLWQRLLGLVGMLAAPVGCLALVFFSITPADRLEKTLEVLRSEPVRVYDTYAVKMLNAERKDVRAMFKDSEFLIQARQAVASAQEQLTRGNQSLQQITVIDEAIKKRVQLAKEYVAAWSRFFSSFQIILERGTPWGVGERNELMEAQEKAVHLYRELFPNGR